MTFIQYTYIVLIILSILLIFSLYFDHPKSIKINQTTVENFNFNLLYEKHPIVIQDVVKNIDDITNLWFKQNFVKKLTDISNDTTNWIKCNSKYTIIQANCDQEIHICNPYTELVNNVPCSNSNVLSIALKSNQFIILPFKWHYFSEKHINTIYIHDIITYLHLF